MIENQKPVVMICVFIISRGLVHHSLVDQLYM